MSKEWIFKYIFMSICYKLFNINFNWQMILIKYFLKSSENKLLVKICWHDYLTNFWLWVDNNYICDHLGDASIQIIKYLNDSYYWCFDSQISPYMCSQILKDSNLKFQLPWEIVTTQKLFHWRIFWLFKSY